MKARRLAGILAAAHLVLGCVLSCEAGTDDLNAGWTHSRDGGRAGRFTRE